jgi:hypothetical protein
VELNGVPLWEGTGDGTWFPGTLGLPAGALRADNELVFLLPEAHSPKSAGQGLDDRVLGLAVRWIRFDPVPQPGAGRPHGIETAVSHRLPEPH